MQIVIANRLKDGLVVYRGRERWVDRIDEAEIAHDPAGAENLLERAKRAVAANEVVDPYLIEVAEIEGALRPTRWRERIRSQGPTVRRDLGYQARRAEAAHAPAEAAA
ncbi:MAG TPA: DUF2849 domain-containing protein [Alphaproteobacteria bacterium]|nr:DUF2849 domain-containing protein [Alphaproteobacteria bacterium]